MVGVTGTAGIGVGLAGIVAAFASSRLRDIFGTAVAGVFKKIGSVGNAALPEDATYGLYAVVRVLLPVATPYGATVCSSCEAGISLKNERSELNAFPPPVCSPEE